jgi:2-polyprenyl-3-methyl-5-hydroxy-6-metoxy-1,4-benzoquinol methylase
VSARRFEIFDRMLGLFPAGSVVDLGAGHGKFALWAASRGWSATAVDARSARFSEDSTVTWVEQDVRQHDLAGYDLVLCLGLFYHLDLPDQLDLLARCKGKPIVIDTHVANGRSTHQVSEEETVGRYVGRWYREPGLVTSSWENPRSFWPTPESFYRMLQASGYSITLAAEPWYLPDRTFFLALP